LSVRRVLNTAVIVAALGYFVDIYDLILFSVIRTDSLKDLGVGGAELTDSGLLVINVQMAGMLLGGVLWGVLGDKRGRLRILFASIVLYSLATIANALVQSVAQYAVLRFIAGVGLAGELGAGVTLVSEVLPAKLRGWGTMLVASVGLCGAVLANIVHNLAPWRTAYFIGGGLGLMLLVLRIRVSESEIFRGVESKGVVRGNFFQLFTSWVRFKKYVKTILIGCPTWYLIGILVTFSPELAKAMGVIGTVDAGWAVMCAYLGLVAGDVASGLLSQLIGSRRKVVILFHSLSALTVVAFFVLPGGRAPSVLYACCAAIGVAGGYWAIFVTVGAEQFGTNLRATAATTVPNFVRGMLVPISYVFKALKEPLGILPAAAIVGAVCISAALIAALLLDETFGRDLDYVEQA
jgi:MFS transporter, putative metabolite:H+ symporter